MSFIELIIIAIGLSMDAFAVSIGKGLSLKKIKLSHALKVGLWFGGFQALMPLMGYLLGSTFADIVSAFDHWVAFALLTLIGGNMIKESIEKDDEGKYQKFEYENEVLDFLQSIDGTKNDRNVLSFLDNERIKEGKLCRHMVMVMPYCASCDAMEKLINDNKDALKNLSDYEIINISSAIIT